MFLNRFSKMGVSSLVELQSRMVQTMLHLFALPIGDWGEFFIWC